MTTMTEEEQVANESKTELVSNTPESEKRDTIRFSEDGDIILNQDSYGIRLLDTPDGRNSASMLINKMYAWRGYGSNHTLSNDPNRITLNASDKGEIVGTVTIGIDSSSGLAGDVIFKDELDRLRAAGARLCEFTKLAFDTSVRSKAALANLFHLAVIYARDLHGCTDIVIEINPRHRRFYEHMLGFKREGELKMHPRVNAPAYLLRVNLDYVTEQIQRYGGTWTSESKERSFYPFFFSPREEAGIRNRLLNIDAREPASSGSH